MPPKVKALLAAAGWSALVAALQAIEPAVPPRYHGVVGLLIIAITGLAKYSPQSAVVMQPPADRHDDSLMGDRRVVEPKR